MAILTLSIGLLLAYANGANDNFKGVATLFGSGTTDYRRALLWATICTALGSIVAIVLARELLSAFTGRGLVPDEMVVDPRFPLAVAFGAGATVLAATRLGLPISTTHALIGALVGVGMLGSAVGVDFGQLQSGFLTPLLVSPVLAIGMTTILYPAIRFLRRRLAITHETCVCVGTEAVAVLEGRVARAQALRAVRMPTVAVDTPVSCHVRYRGRMLGMPAARLADAAHFVSAGAVSFARGLNDTPKIAALLLAGSYFAATTAIALVAFVMACGGLLSARRIADTMGHGITEMSPGQGLTANLVTSALVIGASQLGMPVSTTHVSCGALFGIGATTGQAHWRTIAQILLAWVVTLPAAAVLGMAFAYLVSA